MRRRSPTPRAMRLNMDRRYRRSCFGTWVQVVDSRAAQCFGEAHHKLRNIADKVSRREGRCVVEDSAIHRANSQSQTGVSRMEAPLGIPAPQSSGLCGTGSGLAAALLRGSGSPLEESAHDDRDRTRLPGSTMTDVFDVQLCQSHQLRPHRLWRHPSHEPLQRKPIREFTQNP